MISFDATLVPPWFFDLGSSSLQRCLIDATNVLFLLCYCVSLVVAGYRKEFDNARRNVRWPSVLSSLCCAILAVIEIGTGFLVLYTGEYQLWGWLVPLLRGIIWVCLAVSFTVQPNKFVRVLCTIWWVAFAGLTFVLNLENIIRKNNLEIVDLISWPVCLLILVYAITPQKRTNSNQGSTKENLAEPLLPTQNEKETNFSRAGYLSRLLFLWINPLLKLGYSKPLKQTDIPLLDPDDGAQEACQRFLTEWNNSKTKSVFCILFKCFKKDFILTGLYALFRMLAFTASPLLLHAFVLYSSKEKNYLYEGFILIVYLILMKIVESLSQRHWFFGSRRLGMKMRSALMAAIFQKQLKLSNKGRRHHSAGEVVNYIAVDAYKLGEFPFWLHIGWSQPIQLVLAITLIFCTVGLGTMPGTVPLVLCALLNIPFAKLLQFYQSKFMVAQDARQRATSEVLNNMKIIKLQSWDKKFKETVGGLRDVEVNWLKETQIKKAYGSALYWMSPSFVSAVIFAGTAALNSAPLNADVVFTILATLRVMCEPMRMVPEALSILMQVKVSLDRIGIFLEEEELRKEDITWVCEDDSSEVAVSVRSGEFSWSASGDILHLRGLNLRIKKGEKIAICGPVGAGKSSLLCATLGEIPKISGSVEIHGSIAYVSQSSWIQSGTVQDNILFGKPMNKLPYQNAIRCCALDKDIENFDHGDLAEIGQRGLNMSGGQRQRLQLARAVYSDADIYLLDDPFSAVDAHTGAILFHDCVMSALKNKTVILVTHQVEFLTEVDRILVMENGEVTQEGNYDQLLKAGTTFEQLVSAHTSSITILNTQSSSQETIKPKPVKQNSECKITTPNNPISSIQLTEEEKTETGDLGLRPYLDYFSVSRGWYLLALVILCQCIFVTLQCMATYWLAIVVQTGQRATGVAIGVYAGMSTFSCLFAYIRSLLAANLGLKASREFFKGFMNSVFGAPMLFFDSTPSGRITTRASSDMSTLDFDIPYTLTFVISGTIEVLATVIIMTVVTWELVLIAIPAILLIVYIQRYYIASARELVRINGTTKAPVMNYAAESMLGALTIRAFGMVERFVHTNMRLIDTDASLFFHTNGALEWVLLHVEVLQILLIVASAVLLILLPKGVVSPGFMGLCLSYALTLSSAQANLTRFYSNLENYIISVERIKQFMNIPPEPPAVIVNNRPPPTWPAEGRIALDDIHVKYRESAPYVLKGITCTFAAGSKVGVVGRTGSGKTTLLSTLFRLVDPTNGRILIDSLDICTIGLRDLRTKLSIIPQEPALFRGTVRSNIDPLGCHSDAEIWEALEKCQLKKTITSLPLQLDSAVTDEGENWSVGQRQLFCLGRVLLKKNKILVLDEATASIDSATDVILQQVIKKEFSGCTVITIAHRVPTVTESDMVLVLSDGKLVEYNKPSNLMADRDSAFAKLVAEYWSHYSRN